MDWCGFCRCSAELSPTAWDSARALSLAYLILSCAYFLLGSLGAPWLAPVRDAVPLVVLVAFVLALPALGVALVKPSVVGTTARASKENVRSIGYSIYYTLVNIGGAAGPYVASYVHQRMRVENVFRVAALSVFLMFLGVLLFFREPRRSEEVQTTSLSQAARNFWTVITNPRFMLFLLIFTGYWIVYWQEFITLPLYVHDYINPHTDTELLLVTGPLVVIALTLAINIAHAEVSCLQRHHRRHAGYRAGLDHPDREADRDRSGPDADRRGTRRNHAIASLLRIYFPPGSLGTTGNIYGLRLLATGNRLSDRREVRRISIHYFGEVKHQPGMMWWVITGRRSADDSFCCGAMTTAASG